MPRELIEYHLGQRIKQLDVSQVLFFRADSKCIIAQTPEGEAILDKGESLRLLADEYGAQFIRVARSILVRPGAVTCCTRIDETIPMHLGCNVWVPNIIEPLHCSRRGLRELMKVGLLRRPPYRYSPYENNAGTAAIVEETEQTAPDNTSASSAK